MTTAPPLVPLDASVALSPALTEEPESTQTQHHTPVSSSPLISLKKTPEEQERERAFLAAPFTWTNAKGQPIELKPFARGRESFFHQHREAIKCPPFTSMELRSVNDTLADVARILYILTHAPREWLTLLSNQPIGQFIPPRNDGKGKQISGAYIELNPHVALEEHIMEWAEENISSDLDVRMSDYRLVCDVIHRSHLTRAIPKNDATTTSAGNAPGQ